MRPTSKMRFVKRKMIVEPFSDEPVQYAEVRILQQWWEPYINLGWGDVATGQGEWRDVPLEEEEDNV